MLHIHMYVYISIYMLQIKTSDVARWRCSNCLIPQERASALLERRLCGSQWQFQWAGEENSPTRVENRPPAVITKFHKNLFSKACISEIKRHWNQPCNVIRINSINLSAEVQQL